MFPPARYSLAVVVATFVTAWTLLPRPAFSQPGATAANDAKAGFHFRQVDQRSLEVWEGDRPVLAYNFAEKTLPGVRAAGARSSYVHPIHGLDGEVLTDDFPADHYHHHGLFWGWPHVTISDRHYDLWKMHGIRIAFVRWLEKQASPNSARLGVENAWFVAGKPVMKEEVWLDIHAASHDGRNIDVRLQWTPTHAPVTLGGAEGKSYGGLSLRFAPRSDTIITTPDGPAAEDLLIQKLPWADLSATFKNAAAPSGIALFVDPQHPNFPPEWMTREYGLLAVGWPGVQSATLMPGQSTTVNYRLWIHRAVPTAADIARQYNAYSQQQSVAPKK